MLAVAEVQEAEEEQEEEQEVEKEQQTVAGDARTSRLSFPELHFLEIYEG